MRKSTFWAFAFLLIIMIAFIGGMVYFTHKLGEYGVKLNEHKRNVVTAITSENADELGALLSPELKTNGAPESLIAQWKELSKDLGTIANDLPQPTTGKNKDLSRDDWSQEIPFQNGSILIKAQSVMKDGRWVLNSIEVASTVK